MLAFEAGKEQVLRFAARPSSCSHGNPFLACGLTASSLHFQAALQDSIYSQHPHGLTVRSISPWWSEHAIQALPQEYTGQHVRVA